VIDVAANWERVRAQVARAAQQSGRDPHDIRIVAVSKTKPVELIEAAILAGVTDIGENYVQEAAQKILRIGARVTWHMIGHVQRNKAGRAVELFNVIHTVDSVSLGEALARHGERRGEPVRVLIEVNIGREASKHGVDAGRAEALLEALGCQGSLVIDGLMTVPPLAGSPEVVRPYFRSLRELRDRLRQNAPANAPLRDLSMGMSDDFEAAIEEGATMVRIGRAIFGERNVEPV
jgi:PLP dependent protein